VRIGKDRVTKGFAGQGGSAAIPCNGGEPDADPSAGLHHPGVASAVAPCGDHEKRRGEHEDEIDDEGRLERGNPQDERRNCPQAQEQGQICWMLRERDLGQLVGEEVPQR
jgi:hypothetical protein